jgi:hypothetical protein
MDDRLQGNTCHEFIILVIVFLWEMDDRLQGNTHHKYIVLMIVFLREMGDRLHCNTSHKFSHTYIMSWMHQIWLIDTHTTWITVIEPKIEFLAAHEVSGKVILCIV